MRDRLRPALTPAALFVAAAVISGVTALDGIQPNDEGLMLQAAARIAGGQVPYSDFWWFYPPGQPLLLAGLWEAFGPTLVAWRVVRVLCDALVALLAWRLAVRGGAPRWAALVAWLAAALAMAYPSGPHPYPPTLALALGALLVFERRPALAGVLAGTAAFWRLEFAAYLGLAVLVGCAVARAPQAAARFALAAVASAVVLYAPVVALAGLGPSFDLLVEYPLTDFSDYQSLPFPLDYDGPLNTSSLGGFFSDSAENLLVFYLPLVLVAGLAVGLIAVVRDRSPLRVAVALFAIGMGHYLITRPDVFHTAPLAVMVAVLAAWAVQEGRVLAVAAAAVLAFAIVEGADRRWLELRRDYAELRLPVADGVRTARAEREDLERAVAELQARVPAGTPTYVATRRADLVTSGYPLLYVLAGRPNASRYDIAAPGVVTSAPVQHEIVASLERARPPAVVRDTSTVTAAREPNRAGESSGVTLLDEYLARAYRPVARYGRFEILELR
jgi:hypothetical protein